MVYGIWYYSIVLQKQTLLYNTVSRKSTVDIQHTVSRFKMGSGAFGPLVPAASFESAGSKVKSLPAALIASCKMFGILYYYYYNRNREQKQVRDQIQASTR